MVFVIVTSSLSRWAARAVALHCANCLSISAIWPCIDLRIVSHRSFVLTTCLAESSLILNRRRRLYYLRKTFFLSLNQYIPVLTLMTIACFRAFSRQYVFATVLRVPQIVPMCFSFFRFRVATHHTFFPSLRICRNQVPFHPI